MHILKLFLALLMLAGRTSPGGLSHCTGSLGALPDELGCALQSADAPPEAFETCLCLTESFLSCEGDAAPLEPIAASLTTQRHAMSWLARAMNASKTAADPYMEQTGCQLGTDSNKLVCLRIRLDRQLGFEFEGAKVCRASADAN